MYNHGILTPISWDMGPLRLWLYIHLVHRPQKQDLTKFLRSLFNHFWIKRSDNFGDELGVYTIENCPLKARNLEDDFPLEDFHFGVHLDHSL